MDETSEFQKSVQCNNCEKIYFYDGQNTGSWHLSRHTCNLETSETGKKDKQSTGKTQLPMDVRKKVVEKCTTLCVRDLRSFETVAGDGFLSLAQYFIDVGAEYGKVNASNIVPHPTTISRNVHKIYNNVREEIVPEILMAIRNKEASVSSDMWTHDCKKINYITVTVTYIDNWTLKTRVIFTAKFEEQIKSGENIRNEVYQNFESFGVSRDYLKDIVFVTDQGKNKIKAFEKHDRFDCLCHILNTILRNAFQRDDNDDEIPQKNNAISQFLSSAKSLVTYFKQSGLVSQLDKTLI